MKDFEGLNRTVRESYYFVHKPKNILLGLSGGADSLCLAILLKDLNKNEMFNIACVHVNHGLRESADRDEKHVRQFCDQFGLPLKIKKIYVEAGGSLEAKAREARYQAFYEVKEEIQADVLVLAHHMDDQAETVLMRMMHGAGPTGLAAMREFSNGIWRPLLQIKKQELMDFLTHYSVCWREDESNTDTRFFRNAIRQKLIPVLEEMAPASIRNIARTSVIFGDEEDYWQQYAKQWLFERAALQPSNTFLNLFDFSNLHITAKRRMMRYFCSVQHINLDMIQLDRLIKLAEGPANKAINLPHSVKALRSTQRLHLIPAKRNHEYSGKVVLIDCEKAGNRKIESFDADALHGASVRFRLPGDRITPLGMLGSQLLSKYLIDHKMDYPFRDQWPLLTIGQEVLWVIGFGMAQSAAISKKTKNIHTLAYIGHLPDETEKV